jgi:SAM-dependent methyltransferase
MTCRLCGGPAATAFWTTDRNRGLSDERFEYRRCARCRTVYLENVPDDLARYYPDDYFVFPTVAELDRIARTETYKMDALAGRARGGRLVEIGPGFGVFARRAAVAGFDVCGVEMDARCCAHLREVVGVEAVQTAAPETALAALAPSDVIALWHSLEHLPDPWALLAAAARNLRPGGLLVSAQPNPDALQLRVLGPRWPHVDAPRHLHLIPADTLRERAAGEGLTMVALSSDDGGARHWNAFGWGRAVLPPAPGHLLAVGGQYLGRLAALAAAPLERRPMRGSAYTIVLRKD